MKTLYTLILVLLAGTAYGQPSSNWIQDKTTGCNTFNPFPNSEESIQITGNCVNGYLEGQGVVIWFESGEFAAREEGFYIQGKRNGDGVYALANGSTHVGEYKDGISNGQGILTWPNGNKYVGEFKDGLRNGQATLTYSNGDKYVGEFRNDKIQGQGVYYYLADNQFKGDKYIGEFRDGTMHGHGTYAYFNGDKYVGEFKEWLFIGLGTYTFADGSKYVGEFKDSSYNGQGIFTFVDGRVWLGEWAEAKANGRFIKYDAVGNIEESGIFKDGTLVTVQYIDPSSFNCSAPNKTTVSDLNTNETNQSQSTQHPENRRICSIRCGEDAKTHQPFSEIVYCDQLSR